ncbi:hypothetical protein Bp8pS_038 [Bacillus phage vB_BpuM-BpSp]|nr:hypothetical protein Bp8pS_038 [Bacillus phage vB_BpuM-BpSp]
MFIKRVIVLISLILVLLFINNIEELSASTGTAVRASISASTNVTNRTPINTLARNSYIGSSSSYANRSIGLYNYNINIINSTYNSYLPYWIIFDSVNLNNSQKSFLKDNKKFINDIKNNKGKYWILIKETNGSKKAVSVDKEQYNQLNIGDNIHIKNGLLKIKNK